MKAVKILFCVCLVILTTACVDIQVKTRIDSDGSGMQYWKFVTTALLAGELKKQIELDSFFSKHGKFKDEFKEGDYILTMEVPFDKVEELKASGRNVEFTSKGFLRSTFSYKETWNRNLQDPSSILTKRAESIVPVTMKISVVMPGKIIDSNAENIEGSTAFWNLSLQDITQPKTLTATSKRWNAGTLIALLMLVSTAVAFSILLMNPAGRQFLSKRPLCPSCKSAVPIGSAFCNHCGASLKQT